MPCHSLCGYTNEMRRPHLSCLFCRVRRYFYGKMDTKQYHYNRLMRIVMPRDQTTYILFIDNKRKHEGMKRPILKWWLTIAEWLAN
jgi:hypothetical protein